MNILLTGATGFLGRNLLTLLVNDGHNVSILVRPSSSLKKISTLLHRVTICTIRGNALHELFINTDIETIIHCATNYGRGDVSPVEILETNLLLPIRLVQSGHQYGVRCFINADTILEKRINDYALSKSQFREWFKKYSQKMICINVAMEHFYGPHDDSSKFVSFIVKQLLDDTDRIDLTPGEQKRDFIFIDDILSAFLIFLTHGESLKPGFHDFHIGTGKLISIKEFVEMAKRISGNTKTLLNFGAIPYRENEVMETIIDSNGLFALGWKPVNSFFEGLSKMIAIEKKARIL